MIYPDVPLEEWLKRYPDLKVIEGKCDNRQCGKTKPTIRPIKFRHGIGLEAFPCECGKGRHGTMTMLITDPDENRKWKEILGDL